MAAVAVLACAAVLVVAVALGLAYRNLVRGGRHLATLQGVRVVHARKSSATGQVVEVYPSEAAKDNDPIWARGGSYSVARREYPDGTVTPWIRTYAESFETLQRKD